MQPAEREFYARQIYLPELGEAGQQKLKQARVLVVGAGGLGCPVLQYLTAAGIGNIGICEFDLVSADNLHRQTLYSYEDIGDHKIGIALSKLAAQNPFVQFFPYFEALTAENAITIFENHDLVLDCTDNFATKFLINDAAVLTKTPVLHASLYQYEGQMYGHLPGQTACLRCLWPQTPAEACVGNCEETGIIGAVAGTLGSMQAMEAIKFLACMPNIVQTGEWITLNLLDHSLQKITRPKNPDCPLCGKNPSITTLENSFEVHAEKLQALEPYNMIDIRVGFDPVVLHPTQNNILVCQRGRTSLKLVHDLRAAGHTNVYSLAGGIQSSAVWTSTPV